MNSQLKIGGMYTDARTGKLCIWMGEERGMYAVVAPEGVVLRHRSKGEFKLDHEAKTATWQEDVE